MENIGFITLKVGLSTYQINGIDDSDGKSLVDELKFRRNLRVIYDFDKSSGRNEMNIVFDCYEDELEEIL